MGWVKKGFCAVQFTGLNGLVNRDGGGVGGNARLSDGVWP